MSLTRLVKIKDKISEDLRYDERFVGAGISANKVVVYTNGKKLNGMSAYSADIVTTIASFTSHTILSNKFRPILGGVSVGSLSGLTGTIGGIVNGYMFSASHVLSSNPIGDNGYDKVIQPGAADGGNINDVVGETIYYDKLMNESYGDLAIAKVKSKYKQSVFSVGNINRFTNVYPGKKVIKVGRTTGMTLGLVGTINTDAKVFYPELGREVFLKNQIVIFGKGFSMSGDSGAPVIFNNSYAGIVVAGDGNHTLCTPYDYINNKIKEVVKNEQ